MEYLVFFCIILIGLILYFIKGYFDNRKKEALFREKLRNDFGQYPVKEYQLEQYACISHYFEQNKKSGFYVDEITWNDLEMERVFMSMNHTYSSVGEEYLYDTLRKPEVTQDKLLEREKLIQYFGAQEKERIALQVEFAKLGKTGSFSLCDYLQYLEGLGKRSNRKHIIGNLLYIPAFVMVSLSTTIGILVLVSLICYHIASYFKDKREIEPYIISFYYILRMLRMGDFVEKMDLAVLSEYQTKIKGYKKPFNKFRKKINWIMTNPIAASNPLEILMDYVKMIFHIDLIQFNSMLQTLQDHRKEIDGLAAVLGFIESNIAIAAFRASLPNYCIPQFTAEKGLQIKDAFHPLIKQAVPNSIDAKKGVLLTGSNASGKSTFLKTIAVNAILAQTINTCTATAYQGDLYRIMSSMSLRDSIESGESYYMVEIKSLKRILDASKRNGIKVLCFVDEVLRGTNTIERIAASTQILKSLENPSVLCFAATHDMELTYLLQDEYDNYHFTEEITNGDVFFSYQLLSGRATSRNAIKLLSLMGYEEDIIEKANERATFFAKEGIWK